MGAITTSPTVPDRIRRPDTFNADVQTYLDWWATVSSEIDTFAAALNLFSTTSTSTTSLVVGTGTKNLTVETGKSFQPGNPLMISYTTTPTILMHSIVTSYNSGTGALVVEVDFENGSGTYAEWTVTLCAPVVDSQYIYRSGRTSNTILGTSDRAGFTDVTSGTFDQTYEAAATLGDGWWNIYRNSGTGIVTHNPDGVETIDGLTTLTMYPGECRLIQCDGTALRSIVLSAFKVTFSGTGTFVAPPGYRNVGLRLWGAGASGSKAGAGVEARGGCGGGCVDVVIAMPTAGSSNTITIGAGGEARTTDGNGNTGGNSEAFGLIAYGGQYSTSGSAFSGSYSNDAYASSTGGYLSGALSFATSSSYGTVYGGGGGGTIKTDNTVASVATTIFGGAGGAGSVSENGTAGTAPGGGGGATHTGTSSGAGAAGQADIWGII